MRVAKVTLAAVLALSLLGTVARAQGPGPGQAPPGYQPPGTQATPTPAAQAPANTADTLPWITITEALAAPLGQYVYVRAKVDAVQPPRPGSRAPWNYHVSDASGAGKVVIFQDVYTQIQGADAFKPGVTLELFVEISEYKGQRQLVVTRPAFVRVQAGSRAMSSKFGGANTDAYIPVTIQTITRQTVGRKVIIKGTVSAYEPSAGGSLPNRGTLTDETGSVIFIFWKETGEKIDPSVRFEVGQTVEIGGVVTEFGNTMQVRVDEPQYVRKPAS